MKRGTPRHTRPRYGIVRVLGRYFYIAATGCSPDDSADPVQPPAAHPPIAFPQPTTSSRDEMTHSTGLHSSYLRLPTTREAMVCVYRQIGWH